MAKLDLALIVRTVDKATRPLRLIRDSVKRIAKVTGLDKLGRDLRRVGRAVGRVGREAARFGRRFGLVIGGATLAVVAFAQKYATTADTIAKTADRIGVGVEELQELRHAFDLGGVAIEQTDKGLTFFAKAIGEAASGSGEAKPIFEAMGVAIVTKRATFVRWARS